jgi:hypothetical protein
MFSMGSAPRSHNEDTSHESEVASHELEVRVVNYQSRILSRIDRGHYHAMTVEDIVNVCSSVL